MHLHAMVRPAQTRVRTLDTALLGVVSQVKLWLAVSAASAALMMPTLVSPLALIVPLLGPLVSWASMPRRSADLAGGTSGGGGSTPSRSRARPGYVRRVEGFEDLGSPGWTSSGPGGPGTRRSCTGPARRVEQAVAIVRGVAGGASGAGGAGHPGGAGAGRGAAGVVRGRDGGRRGGVRRGRAAAGGARDRVRGARRARRTGRSRPRPAFTARVSGAAVDPGHRRRGGRHPPAAGRQGDPGRGRLPGRRRRAWTGRCPARSAG